MMRKTMMLALAASLLAGCSSVPSGKSSGASPRTGGYYLNDGPGDNPPPNLADVPDAVPRDEPLHKFANRPYEVMGVAYTPMSSREPYRQSGVASWYGRRYHGQKTSSGEVYDMYGMTAAHPTLPIPSYVRVTSLDYGKTVVVRVNDRGPFLGDRIIDLSYTAAYKLGLLQRGSGRVSVESIVPETSPLQSVEPIQAQPLPEPATARSATLRPGFYVQLGAFGSQDNARKLLLRAREVLSIPSDLIEVALVDSLHRVNLGPFANREEAGGWVEKSNAALGIAAITVTR
jgi:rare lipoprotein A